MFVSRKTSHNPCKIRKGTAERDVAKHRAVVGRELYYFVTSYWCTLEQSLNWIFYTFDKLTNSTDIYQYVPGATLALH